MNGLNMPPRPPRRQNDGIKKPERLSEMPGYILNLVRGFFTRLFYIVSLVLEAAPALLFLMVLLCLLDGILPVIGAYISKDLLNEVAALIGATASGSIAEDIFVTMRPLLFLFAAYFVFLILRKVMTRLNGMVTNIAGEKVANHIRLKIIGKANTVDLASFDRPEFYEKLENANREAGMRPIQILSATFSVVSACISAVSFVVVLAGLSPFAPLVIIAAAIPGAAVNYLYRKKSFHYIRRHSKERRQMTYYSEVMINKDMAKEVRLLGLGDSFTEKYKKVFKKYYEGLKRLIVKEGVTQLIVGLVSSLASCLLFIYVAYKVIYLDGEIGDYSLYTGALTSITGYVTTLLTATATIYEGTLFINNMIDFMKEEPTVVPTAAKPLKAKKGSDHTIEFKNVSFRYPGTKKDVLKNINLTFAPGDSVVLVGLNGAGKTTLIKLLTRLYDPTDGVILLDGRDIREYDVKALYDLFGIIFQDFGRYAETAADNIAFGDVGRKQDMGEIITAADRASADEFIGRLPKGYETPLTRLFEEEGIELSGGQWQKLSVARAFYKDSDILILDEPTASLDAIAEKEVFDRFTELSHDKLTVFVSHRLSSAVSASKIVVISGGEITEVGTHEELMAKKGEYHRLFTTQASRYTGEDV
nr:ABC transporter ATP-binding protein [Oscillospiraceae bacterium]